MDSYTIIILSILILAIQGLGLHSIFTLFSNEEKLRQTMVTQGRELIRLRNELQHLSEQQNAEMMQLDGLRQDQPLDEHEALKARLDNGETLDELIARYEMDEAEAYHLINQPQHSSTETVASIN